MDPNLLLDLYGMVAFGAFIVSISLAFAVWRYAPDTPARTHFVALLGAASAWGLADLAGAAVGPGDAGRAMVRLSLSAGAVSGIALLQFIRTYPDLAPKRRSRVRSMGSHVAWGVLAALAASPAVISDQPLAHWPYGTLGPGHLLFLLACATGAGLGLVTFLRHLEGVGEVQERRQAHLVLTAVALGALGGIFQAMNTVVGLTFPFASAGVLVAVPLASYAMLMRGRIDLGWLGRKAAVSLAATATAGLAVGATLALVHEAVHLFVASEHVWLEFVLAAALIMACIPLRNSAYAWAVARVAPERVVERGQLAELGDRLTRELDPGAVAQTLVDGVATAFDATGVALLVGGDSDMKVAATAGDGLGLAHGLNVSGAPAAGDVKTLRGAPAGAIPLWAGDRSVGALLLGPKASGAAYFEEDYEALIPVVHQAAAAYDNASLHERIEQAALLSRELFEAVMDPVIAVRLFDGRIQTCNAAAREMLRRVAKGTDGQDGRPLSEYLGAAAREWLVGEPDAVPQAFRYTKPGRRKVHMHLRAVDLPRPEGTIRVFVLHDVTERKEYERMQADFVGMVSHELRSPLTVILGFATLLQNEKVIADEYKRERAIDGVLRQSRHMSTLVTDLLTAAQIEACRLRLCVEPVDLRQVAKGAVEGMEQVAPLHGFDLRLPEDPVVVLADPDRVSQVARNLVGNAVKYSPDGGVVTVEVSGGAKEATLSVSDQGIGIPEDVLPRIFDRFYQADGGPTRAVGGVGMGLYIVNRIVAAHRGRIDVASEVGRGSRFAVRLPVRGAQGSGGPRGKKTSVGRPGIAAGDVPQADAR